MDKWMDGRIWKEGREGGSEEKGRKELQDSNHKFISGFVNLAPGKITDFPYASVFLLEIVKTLPPPLLH